MKKIILWLKVIGLLLLLVSWGADNFWKKDAEEKLSRVEFITVNTGIVSNNADLQFLKYIIQNRSDPKLLSLSYRNLLQSIVATCELLKRSGANLSEETIIKSKELLAFVQNAYDTGISLEPRDIKRNIKHEIVEFEKETQQYFANFLISSRKKLKTAGFLFVTMYILGSTLVIASVMCQYFYEKHCNVKTSTLGK